MDRGEHADHRVIHPHIDRSELVFDGLRCALDGWCIGDVRCYCQRGTTALLDLIRGGGERILAARNQTDPRAAISKCAGARAPHARARTGNHDDRPVANPAVGHAHAAVGSAEIVAFASVIRRLPTLT
jgi:hypothetical protein